MSDRKKHESAKGDMTHPEHEMPHEAASAEGKPAPAAEADRVRELEEAVAAKDAEAKANWDKFLRERADLENYRKRVQREKEEILKYGNESLIKEILPVIDNIEQALVHASEETQGAVIEGVKLTRDTLLAALKKFGVLPIENAVGAPFDPAFHEAMCQVESCDHGPNTVVEEFRKGYLLNERLIRPTMVSVACQPKSSEP